MYTTMSARFPIDFDHGSNAPLPGAPLSLSPHHSHSDPWALDYICCDSPAGHGAPSGSSRGGTGLNGPGLDASVAAPMSAALPAAAAAPTRSQTLPMAMGSTLGTGMHAAATSGASSRRGSRNKPNAAHAPGHGHRRSQSQSVISRLGSHLGPVDAKSARSLPTSAQSSPSAIVPFSAPAIAPSFGSLGPSLSDPTASAALQLPAQTQTQPQSQACSPELCCDDVHCDQMEVECCTDPACDEAQGQDICDAPHGECTHLSPPRPSPALIHGVSDADGGEVNMGHSHLFGEGLGEHLDHGHTHGAGAGDKVGQRPGHGHSHSHSQTLSLGAGAMMLDGMGDGGTTAPPGAGERSSNLDGALEGDELVKWACSDEGCAAIQQYVSLA